MFPNSNNEMIIFVTSANESYLYKKYNTLENDDSSRSKNVCFDPTNGICTYNIYLIYILSAKKLGVQLIIPSCPRGWAHPMRHNFSS